jgi:hypothetical protein
MEDVRPIRVDQDSSIVKFVEGIATNVSTFIDDQHFATNAGEAFGQHATGETSANDQVIKHGKALGCESRAQSQSQDVNSNPSFSLSCSQDSTCLDPNHAPVLTLQQHLRALVADGRDR